MMERYGGNSKMVICSSVSTHLNHVKKKYPEAFKREFNNKVKYGDVAIIPLSPHEKIAVLNARKGDDVVPSTLVNILKNLKGLMKEYKITNFSLADDFCYGNENCRKKCMEFLTG